MVVWNFIGSHKKSLDHETATSLRGQAEDDCLSKFSHANDAIQFRLDLNDRTHLLFEQLKRLKSESVH